MSEIEQEMKQLSENLSDLQDQFKTVQKKLQAQEQTIRESIRQAIDRVYLSNMDEEKLEEFLKIYPKRPYAVVTKTQKKAIIACPIYIPLAIGWLVKQDGAYNLWEVNKYVPLFQQVPKELLEELDFRPAFDGIMVDKERLIIERPDIDDPKNVFRHYKQYLSEIEDEQTIKVKPKKTFDLICALIRDGILPFVPQPVAKQDLRQRTSKVELRDYQQRDYKIWLENGVVGLQYPMGAGKSFVALKAMDLLKGKKLVLVPSRTLKEQWNEYIQQYTNLEPDEYLVEVYHKNAMKRLKDQEFMLIVFDEMHRLGAPTFLQLSTLSSKYRMNLTGTPWREDGRHDLVMALSGLPLGVDWQFFLREGIIYEPEITVHVVKTSAAKLDKLEELLAESGKTLVFCDSLKLGERISKRFDIPFISGSTKKRLELIRDSEKVAISRVGDLGISLKELRRVVEIDFLYGSRTQEAQRIGRLHHARKAGEHHLLMTAYEYVKYRKRLWGIESKGFRVKVKKAEGVEKDLEYGVKPAKPKRVRAKPTAKRRRKKPALDIETAVKNDKLPFLSDRDKPSKNLLKKILASDFARAHQGLRGTEVKAILDHFYIKHKKTWVNDTLKRMYNRGEIQGRRVSKVVRRYFLEKRA